MPLGSTSSTSNPRSSSTPKSGIQYTPVDSRATVSMPHSAKPVRHAIEIAGEGFELPDRRIATVLGDCREVALGAHIYPGRVHVHLRQARRQYLRITPRSASTPGALAFCLHPFASLHSGGV